MRRGRGEKGEKGEGRRGSDGGGRVRGRRGE